MRPPIHAVIFDLDDTLYEESTYYACGFRHAAAFLSSKGLGTKQSNYRLFTDLHNEIRAQVFDRALMQLDGPRELAAGLLRAFYAAPLALSVPPTTTKTLLSLASEYRLGLITDGHAHVQARKLESLEIKHHFQSILITDEFGRDFWKPNPAAFAHCCHMLSTTPQSTVFVGDNPERDIAGAVKAGLLAIRLRTPGRYFSETASDPTPPFCEITELEELVDLLANLKNVAA